MPFFQYSQNNSGGMFTGPAHYVIIEAQDYKMANALAETHGLYFDGSGDCRCCGNRWCEQAKWSDADVVPSIYGQPVERYKLGRETAIVYYWDGREAKFGFKD